MSSNIKNAPKKIYLQIDLDEDVSEIEFNSLSEVSWCAEKIFASDLEYEFCETKEKSFTKKDMINFAKYALGFKGVSDKENHLDKVFYAWSEEK